MSSSGGQLRDARVVSFTPFTFDLESGELTLRGRKLFLQEQHARVLAALLQQPGRVLSREELKETIWPGVAFVDYQHAINKAVSQLRKTLNDDSRMPRFIETIPKRGYRFCTEVHFAAPGPAGQPLAPAAPPLTPEISAAVPMEAPPQGMAAPLDTIAPPVPEQPEDTFRASPIRINARLWISASLLLLAFAAAAATAGLAWRKHAHSQRSPTGALPVSIGIPPFETSGPGAPQMAENFRLDLTDSLAQLPEVRIRAAHAFTGAPRDEQSVRGMALEQHLDVLVLGTFAVNNGLCVLSLELVRTSDTSHIASFHYTGTPRQLRAVRDNIQRDVFTKLKLNVASPAPTPPSARSQAYAIYLEGRQHLTERSDEALRQSVKEFKEAIALDPKFADAWSGLASVTMLLADRDPPGGTFPQAKEFALHAVELDASQAQAHAVLGCIAMSHEWKRAEAEKQLALAVQLDPDEAVYHVWLAALFGLEGRYDQGFRQVDLAREDDPFWPPVYQTEVAIAASAAQPARLLSAAQKLVALTPSWPAAHDQMAWADWYSGHYPEAIAEWHRMAALAHDKPREEIEDRGLEAYRAGGVQAYAHLRMHALEGETGFGYRSKTLQAAEWSAYASEPDRALSLLTAMVENHDPSAVDALVDPAFFPLRDDPRYKSLAARIDTMGA